MDGSPQPLAIRNLGAASAAIRNLGRSATSELGDPQPPEICNLGAAGGGAAGWPG